MEKALVKCSLSWRIASYHHWEQSNTDRHDRGLRSTENKLTKPSYWTRLEVKMENLRALWGRSECSPEHLFFFGNQVTLSIKHSNKVPEGEEIRWRLVCVWAVKWFYESLCVCADLCSGLKQKTKGRWGDATHITSAVCILCVVCQCTVCIDYVDDLLHSICENVHCANEDFVWCLNAMQCTWPEP